MLLSQHVAAKWRLPPAGDPPERLSLEVADAWRAIVAAMPFPPRRSDEWWLELSARMVNFIRMGHGSRSDLREAYRCLGLGFIPMPARRRLLLGKE